MNIQGKLIHVGDVQQITGNFSKREFVVEIADNPMYPQEVLFQCVNDRTNLVDGISVGSQIEVTFNLRGRKWTSPKGEVKWFNTLDAWQVKALELATVTTTTSAQNEKGETDDDLPF